MQFSFDELQNLLKHWETFKNQGGSDLGQFGDFLSNREKKPTSSDLVMGAYPKEAPLEPMIGYLWARMLRYTSFLTKKALEDTPIKSLDEFGVMITVKEFKDPKKSEVVKESLLETTTCFEIIKRLVKIGLIKEVADESDQRVRRTMLTDEGTIAFEKIQKKVFLLSQILVGHSSTEDKVTLTRILKSLDDFHTQLDVHHQKDSIEEIFVRTRRS